jgi:hypothetical protein
MKSTLLALVAGATLALSAAPALAATSPFVGTWKLDAAKSSFTGDSFTYTALPGGKLAYTYGTTSHYTFPCNGTTYALDLASYTASCTKTSQLGYTFTTYAKGKRTDVDVVKISASGTVLSDTDTSYRPDGTIATSSATYKRVGAGTGIAGTWKGTKVSVASPPSVAFTATPAGLKMTSPAYKWSLIVKADGSKAMLTGPTVPPNAYVVSTATGPATVHMAYYIGGKLYGSNTLTVSADGKTLRWTQQAPGAAVTTGVYEKA